MFVPRDVGKHLLQMDGNLSSFSTITIYAVFYIFSKLFVHLLPNLKRSPPDRKGEKCGEILHGLRSSVLVANRIVTHALLERSRRVHC